MIFTIIIGYDVVVSSNKIQRKIVILRSNQSFLVENMRLREGLIDQLRLSDCLTDVQARLLNRQTVVNEKTKPITRNNNSDLLHVIRSCDDTRRSDCLRCLRQSVQKLVTKVTNNGGGLPWNYNYSSLLVLDSNLELLFIIIGFRFA